MCKLISLILAAALTAINIYSQDIQKSVGPAPMQYKIEQSLNQGEQSLNQGEGDLAIGSRCWIYLSSSPTFQFQKGFLESCAMTSVGAPFTVTFPGALAYKNGTILMNNQSAPYQIYSIDTITGVHTLIVNATGIPQANFTGMTWDGTTLYGVSTTLAASQIFTINLSTGVCTPIGAPSAVCAGAISVSAAPNGNLYSIDIINDNFYRWNKVTGVPTLIGPLGFNANFGQDAQFDWRDTTLYWAGYTTGPGLYKININTGGATLLCTYPAQVTGIAISNSPPPPVPFCEQFATTIFPPPGWTYLPGGTAYWLRNTASGFGIGFGSAVWDSWNAPNGTRQTMFTPVFTPATGTGSFLNIDVAYQAFGTSPDSLIIAASTDFGTTYTSVARLSYLQLATTSGNPSPFVPTASQWKKLNFILPTGTNKMLFQGYSGFGDLLYIDSLCITYVPVGINNNNSEVPKNYSLSQNYPNPFNPTTIINFGLPKAGNVKLVLYDVLGREVKTLVDEFKQAGNYNINFDGTSIASGIYFYSITSGDFTATKKMLLIK